jgi:hypothetical protein
MSERSERINRLSALVPHDGRRAQRGAGMSERINRLSVLVPHDGGEHSEAPA